MQLLKYSVGGGPDHRAGPGCELWVQDYERGGFYVSGVQCFGAGYIRVRWACGGAGDSGNYSIYARVAVEGADVERGRVGLFH